MPILVAILSAQKGALIIIENPEAHLHPNGIAKLTELICLASQAGIQIILETHSDHIINGILVQSKKFEQKEKGIDRNNVSIYHFFRDEKEHCTIPNEIKILEGGRLSKQPEGFFDQIEIDLEKLMGF
jgi:predicted ATPase